MSLERPPSFDPERFGRKDYELVAALPWEQVAGLGARYRLVVGAWLLARRLEVTDGTWTTEHLPGFAADLDVSVSSLSRWMAHAAGLAEVALPGQERTGPKPRPAPAVRVTVETDTGVNFPTGKPETVEDVRRLGNLVANVGAGGWAKALTVDRIDTLIGVLKAARTEALRSAAITTSEARKGVKAEGCEHDWKQRKGGPVGVSYVCERCELVTLQRPA